MTDREFAVATISGAHAGGVGSADYFATPAIAAYFDAREHEAYYQALKRVGPRRDFHQRVVPVLERFVELTNSPEGAAAVDRVIGAPGRFVGAGTILELLSVASTPRGSSFLALPSR